MSLIDIGAAVFFVFMLLRGWRAGAIVMLGNIASIFVGVVVTTYIFRWLSTTLWLTNWHNAHPVIAIVVFLLLMGVVVRLLRIVVGLFNGLYRVASVIPLLGPINTLVGAVVGILEAGLFTLVVVYVCNNILFTSGMLSFDVIHTVNASLTYSMANTVLDYFAFLFPMLEIFV